MPLFERDRYQRLDGAGAGGAGRKPSPFCSSATIVAFVALCLVGAWMMTSSSSIPAGVSEAKEADVSAVAFAQNVNGAGDDTPATSGQGGDAGKNDDSGAPRTTDSGGSEDVAGAGATRTTDSGGSDDVAGTTTTDATSSGTTAGGGVEADGTSKPAAGAVVSEGETASGNQTFSDENGKTEGGEVAKPEDPDTRVEPSAEDAATTGGQGQPDESAEDAGGQADNTATPEVTGGDKDPGDQVVAKSGQSASSTDSTGGGGQVDQDTPTDGSTPKNQTTSDDANNGNAGEGGQVPATSSEEASGNDGASTTTTADDTTNGTVSSESVATTTNSSSAITTTVELLPSGQADLLNETASSAEPTTSFPTQAAESSKEKKKNNKQKKSGKTWSHSHVWKLCNATSGADYIPCLDNTAAIRSLKSTSHYEHRERHCPSPPPTCLVPLPAGYRQPIPWPHSRDKVWYHNVPHAGLAQYKGHQNWVKVSGEHLTFPGGGTQFKNGGARHYADVIERALPEEVAWGRRTRVALDVGCGVASFGGYLFDRDVATLSFAPKDEHEAQVQFALERGIPAVSAVMGTVRLPVPGNAFDAVHCARCRVPWHADGGRLLLEANRVLRPGGLFIWSATPVYRKVPEDVSIWHAMVKLTESVCWEMLKRTSDAVDQTALVVFKKPTTNACLDARPRRSSSAPPLCDATDDPDAAWNVTLRACVHRVPTAESAHGARWPPPWPERLAAPPRWMSEGQTTGVYGKPAPADFAADLAHWRRVVNGSYLRGAGVDWKHVRNVMDMRAGYGGFAAALRDVPVWVMNVVPVDAPDTLPVIYDRGLFGMYHDWCESFSTYPRSYDLLHADHLFSGLKTRCRNAGGLLPVIAEVDRILRPDGTLIVRDDKGTVEEVQSIVKSLHWEVRMTVSNQGEEMLCVTKTKWRPTEVETAPS